MEERAFATINQPIELPKYPGVTPDAVPIPQTSEDVQGVVTAQIGSELESQADVWPPDDALSDTQSDAQPAGSAPSADEIARLDQARRAENEMREAALRDFFEDHVARLMRLPALSGFNVQDRQNVLQEAAIRVWRHADKFYSDEFNVIPWLNRIVTNLAIDESRRQKVRVNPTDPIETDSALTAKAAPDNVEEAVLAGKGVAEALLHLAGKPELVDIVQAIDLDGLSYAEYAEARQINVGTVRSRLHRARKLLKAALEPMKENGEI